MKERGIIFQGWGVKAIQERRKTQTRRLKGLAEINAAPDAWRFCGNHNDIFQFYHDLDDRHVFLRCPYGVPGDRLWVRETWASVWFETPGYETGICDDWHGLNPVPKTKAEAIERGGWPLMYAVDETGRSQTPEDRGWRWRPSIFMPRWASRINLEIKAVRVERVQEVSAYSALMEGVLLPEVPNAVKPLPFPDGFGQWTKQTQDKWFEGAARTTYFAQCADADNHIQEFRKLWDSINAKKGYGWDINPWPWVVEFRKLGE